MSKEEHTLSEMRSLSSRTSLDRKEFWSRASVVFVVRKQVPPTFRRTHCWLVLRKGPAPLEHSAPEDCAAMHAAHPHARLKHGRHRTFRDHVLRFCFDLFEYLI